jgi:outer membrane protein assembly factor BamD (BamD/ComL family)
MAKIILAQSYFESGEYTKAIEAIGDAHYNQPEKQQGYSYTLYLQALSIKGKLFVTLFACSPRSLKKKVTFYSHVL